MFLPVNSSLYPMLTKISNLMSDLFYKELVKPEKSHEDTKSDEKFYVINEFEEVFADHICMTQRLQKTLYRGNMEDLNEENDHPPIALTELALKLFTKAAPNYGLDLLDMDYVSSVSESTRVSPCAMILALIYLERLKTYNSDYLESESPAGLFVVTMLVASKFLFEDEDDAVANQIWAELLNIDIKELNHLEQKFLAAVDWKIYVSASEYFQYLSGFEKMIALKQSALRGWLSYSDAYSILQDVAVMKFLISGIEKIVKISVISILGYAVTVLSVFIAEHSLLSRCNKTALKQGTVLNSDLFVQRNLSKFPPPLLPSELSLLTDKSTEIESAVNDLSIHNNVNHEVDFKKEAQNFMNLPIHLYRLSALAYSNKQAPANKHYTLQKAQSVLNINISLSKGLIKNKAYFIKPLQCTLQVMPVHLKEKYCTNYLVYSTTLLLLYYFYSTSLFGGIYNSVLCKGRKQ